MLLTVRARLARWSRSGTTPQRVVRRSQIVLLALDGFSPEEIATRLGVSVPTVRLWMTRFERGGPDALLHDAPGRGRRASIDAATLRDQLREAHLLDERGRPVSLRRAAAFLHVSASAVWRALRRSGSVAANTARKDPSVRTELSSKATDRS
jgi:transposase